MSNKHYNITDEIEVSLKLRVSDICLTNYHKMTEQQIQDAVHDIHEKISEYLGLHIQGGITDNIIPSVDTVTFEVEYLPSKGRFYTDNEISFLKEESYQDGLEDGKEGF